MKQQQKTKKCSPTKCNKTIYWPNILVVVMRCCNKSSLAGMRHNVEVLRARERERERGAKRQGREKLLL